MIVAIIPARAGSKRIPKKNIRDFCGRPMITWPIRAALESGVFEKVIVTTDSEQIAEVARSAGAEVPFMRPPELSDDHTPTAPVVEHALNWLIENERMPDYACCLYATAPFVRAQFLRQGLEIIREHQAATCFSVTTFPFPIFRGLQLEDDGRVRMIWPEFELTRSQDLVEAYHDAGMFYWLDSQKFLASKKIYADDARPVIIPRHFVQDIDTEEDFLRAELMFKAIESSGI